ncbi:MAG: sulfatase, partial [Chloroflexota bacterium]
PQELNDLALDPAYTGVLAECEAKLRDIVDPEAADAQAHAAQRKRIEELGGRDAVLGLIGDFGFTPIDG